MDPAAGVFGRTDDRLAQPDAALTLFVLILSFEHRDVWVFNSGDLAVRIEALFLAISPCGAALSLDQVRSAGKFWSAQQRPQWPIRSMQVQLSLIYLGRRSEAEWRCVAAGHRRVLRFAAAGSLLVPMPHRPRPTS